MPLGSIKTWLNLHSYLGLIGFILVMLHAGLPFQFRYNEFGPGTISAYLMIIAIISGFIGRYLYKRMDDGEKKIFKYWRHVHISLVGALFFSIAMHIIRP